MNKYISFIKNYDFENRFINLLFSKEDEYDEIILDDDMNYNSYEDVIISDISGLCEDIYIDDTLDYIK